VHCSKTRIVLCLAFTCAASARAGDSERVEQPSGALSLKDALALALTNSPDPAAFAWDARASEARRLQAGLLPNPDVTVTVEDFAGTGDFRGFREAQTTLQLSQVIELGGKRAGRREVAAAAHDLAGREYEVKRVEVLADVTEKFIEVIGAQLELALEAEAVKSDEAALQSVRERVTAGKTSPLEEKNSAVTLTRGRIARAHAERELAAARAKLAATWGSDTAKFERAEADLFAVRTPPSFETLAGRIVGSPEVTRWATEKRMREAELKLARVKRTPNVTLGGGARRLEGPDEFALVAEVSVPLPLFDRSQGDVAEAKALSEKAGRTQRAAEVRLRALLFAIYQELQHAALEVELTRKEVLPQAEEALRIAEQGYREGRFSYLELADAQRTLLDVKRQYVAAAMTYHKLTAEIERLTGQPLNP